MLQAVNVLISGLIGHASMVQPPPRNAVDRDLSPWNGSAPGSTQWDHHVDTPICPVADPSLPGNLSLKQGQSCFWFSHGCTIFCPRCDGKTARAAHAGACDNEKTAVATICDPEHRTLNRQAPCGTEADTYYFNPWRAPGSAPVFDACGMAGGSSVPAGAAAAGVRYHNTSHAVQGDAGSRVLPARPTGTVWKAGGIVEVSWTLRTNHGGGYQYRIAPANGSLTEAEFQKTPLPFATETSTLRWDGDRSTDTPFVATFVSTGTLPVGSTWAMNPLPRVDSTRYPGRMDSFPAPCNDTTAPDEGGFGGRCSGWYGPDNLEIVDRVVVPLLPAGSYVVQFRWDCEESAQVWMNCADVTVQA